jgi:hypothetical protein
MGHSFVLANAADSVTIRAGGVGPTGVLATDWNLGFASPRVVSFSRPGQPGTKDLTALHDGRTVSMSLTILGDDTYSIEWYYDKIAAMCYPGNRPILYISNPNWDSGRAMTLRADPLSRAVTKGSAGYHEVSLSMVCPSGLMDDATTQQATMWAAGTDTGLSLTAAANTANGISAAPTGYGLPAAAATDDGITSAPLGLSLSSGSSASAASVFNTGTTPTYPRMFLYGPITNPVVRNNTTGQQLFFNGLTVPAGSYLDIDVENRTVYMNSSSAQSFYGKIVWTQSQWWVLTQGENDIIFTGTATTNTSQLIINYVRHWI